MKLLMGLALFIIAQITDAATLTTFTRDLNDATGTFNSLLTKVFYLVGITLCVASIVQYREYRQNPMQTPLRRVLFFLLAGLIIIALPFSIQWLGDYLNNFS